MLGHAHTSSFERGDLVRGRACAAFDDRASMSHTLAGRRGLPGDEAGDRLGHIRSDELGCLLFIRAADLADQNDLLGLRIMLEQLQRVNKVCTVDRVAADAHASRSAHPHDLHGIQHFIGERT